MGLLDEGELFMELIRDVSNELDIDVLCHKILVNVGLLTRADRGSLFLVRGKHLVAKLFDVTVDTGKNNNIELVSLKIWNFIFEDFVRKNYYFWNPTIINPLHIGQFHRTLNSNISYPNIIRLFFYSRCQIFNLFFFVKCQTVKIII